MSYSNVAILTFDFHSASWPGRPKAEINPRFKSEDGHDNDGGRGAIR